MTPEQIATSILMTLWDMRRSAEKSTSHSSDEVGMVTQYIERVLAAERRACARIADDSAARDRTDSRKTPTAEVAVIYEDCAHTAETIAKLIRARGAE